MRRSIALLLTALVAAAVHAAAVDIDSAATLYRDASIREQVRSSLPTMPEQIRKLFAADNKAGLTPEQLAAVSAAAKHGFRIDVFEAPALTAFAANLDAPTIRKAGAFLESDLGRRMVSADVALAATDQGEIDRIMNGEITAPTTPQREALFDKIERASRSTESTVDIFLGMGTAVAAGTAIGSGMDRAEVEARAQKSGDDSRAALENDMRLPLRRYMAYGYRDLNDADLKHILAFLESTAGKKYIGAYIASLDAGFDAMGRRCGEQLGESLREMAQAKFSDSEIQQKRPQ
jgi:hypothetical protein